MLLDSAELDALDLAIISHLQDDGRRRFTEIAAELNVSSGTVKNRYIRLEELGVLSVQGYINPYRLGLKTHAVVLIKARAGSLEDVASALTLFDEVDFIAITTGHFDFDVTVSCLDHEHLLDLIHRIHAVKGVTDTRTTMILRVVKNKQSSIKLKEQAYVKEGRP